MSTHSGSPTSDKLEVRVLGGRLAEVRTPETEYRVATYQRPNSGARYVASGARRRRRNISTSPARRERTRCSQATSVEGSTTTAHSRSQEGCPDDA